MTTRHIAAESARLHDLTPEGSSGRASKRFRQKLASDGFTVEEGFRLKPGYIYTVVRAISARVNQNYDGWPSDELKKSYKTFIGKPVFVNHENHDPTKARGVVVAARYVENGMDKYVEVVQEIDAQRFPKLAHEIKTGGLDSVSMGAEAGFTICSYCKNKATDLHDMCDHVKNYKGKTLTKFDRRTGKKEDILVFESCHKISFFELSYVFEPADETAVASKVVVAGLDKKAVDFRHDPRREGESQEDWFNRLIQPSPGQHGQPLSEPRPEPPKAWDYTHHKTMPWLKPDGFSWHPHFVDWYTDTFGKHPDRAGSEGKGSLMDSQGWNGASVPGAATQYIKHLEAGGEPWNPDEDLFDPRQFGASRRTAADDLAIPAPPGSPKIDQSVIDSTPVVNLSPATELTGEEAPGVGLNKASGKYTKEDFAAAGGKKPWESESESDAEDAAAIEIEAMMHTAAPAVDPRNTQRTQRPGTKGTYIKAHDYFDSVGAPGEGKEGVLDYGAGLGHSAEFGHTYEPYPREGGDFQPTYVKASDVPPESYHRVTNLNVLNVVPPRVRNKIVRGIGQAMAPGGHAIITTRSHNDVQSTKNAVSAEEEFKDPGAIRVNPGTKEETYQKGFTRDELAGYVQKVLGRGYSVTPVNIGPAGVHVVKDGLKQAARSAALKKIARANALKLAFGETEAPMAVDTLREEGSAPEDDDDDDERYVDPPKNEFASRTESPQELQDPDLEEAGQVDREQEEAGASPDQMGGVPGAAEGGPAAPQQQFMTLQIPIPAGAPQIPMQAAPPQMAQPTPAQDPAAPPQQISASLLDYFDGYYGRRVANWMDAIEARRDMTPAEIADYRRQAARLSTLENGREHSTTNRNPTKGTATMARSTIASRSKVARTGRRQHFAEGPLVDGGDRSRNDQGEQEEAFISQTPPEVAADIVTDDTPNISNTEHNLVARVQAGREQLLRDAQALAEFQHKRALTESGGPTAEVVDPTVNAGPGAEELTGTGFVSADPNDGVVPTNPKDASLRAFQAFDSWLAEKTGKSSRRHTEANIKKAAAAFSREAGISPQMLFPALGIVLREARKNDKKATKGAAMNKRANESLEVAAPDGRVDVTTPVKNTDAEAQASQFDLHDFGNNAGDNVAKPDLSTDQNWAPGEASGKKAAIKTAGGLLAMRCAEGMIAAGLEPNSRERKYQLAAEFENMNRGLIQDRVALLERFAAVREADLRKVASGSSRGAARSPIPAGLGGGTRTASAGPRLAAHDPSNDSSLFI